MVFTPLNFSLTTNWVTVLHLCFAFSRSILLSKAAFFMPWAWQISGPFSPAASRSISSVLVSFGIIGYLFSLNFCASCISSKRICHFDLPAFLFCSDLIRSICSFCSGVEKKQTRIVAHRNNNPIIVNQIAAGPHSGHVTHHQDQSMNLVNLSTMKTMASKPQKLMPPDEFLLLMIIFFQNLQYPFELRPVSALRSIA